MARVRKLVPPKAIRINVGRWERREDDLWPKWATVRQCALYNHDDWATFRLTLGRPLQLPTLKMTDDRVGILHMSSGALTATDDAENTDDPQLRLITMGTGKGTPSSVASLPYAAVYRPFPFVFITHIVCLVR